MKRLLRNRMLIFLMVVAVLIKLFSLNAGWVENSYSNGLYPVVSKTLRAVLGWVPFSVGDVLYIAAFVWLVLKVWKLVNLLKRKQAKIYLSWMLFGKYVKLALFIYIVFNLLWGLNYNRQGIEAQLGLQLKPYTHQDLDTLTRRLQDRLLTYAGEIDSVERLQYKQNSFLFKKGEEAYRNTQQQHPFLSYTAASIKPSLLTPVGNWFGFTGYYNPFSAEAQIKTDIPVFLKPFVVTHEMAHQLGYAKENEANFVAYLTCKASANVHFLYSAYFELYRDAIVEYATVAGKEQLEQLKVDFSPRIVADIYELQLYFVKNKNFIEPFMSGAYDNYLKLNNQPKGKATYNEVIAYLVAYMKKYGAQAI